MLTSARITAITTSSLVVVSLLTSVASAQQPATSASANRASTAAPEQEAHFDEQLKARLQAAVKAFDAGRVVAAERDLRDAGNLIDQQSKKVTGNSRERLESTTRDLNDIAARVRNGKIDGIAKLREELARVHLRLAMHHTVECQHCLKHADSSKPAARSQLAAGLDAGLFHFEEAARLTGRKLNKAARHGLMQSRDTVELIAEGSRDTVADSGRAVSWLARELKDMVREGHIGVGVGFEETDLAPSLIK